MSANLIFSGNGKTGLSASANMPVGVATGDIAENILAGMVTTAVSCMRSNKFSTSIAQSPSFTTTNSGKSNVSVNASITCAPSSSILPASLRSRAELLMLFSFLKSGLSRELICLMVIIKATHC